MVIISLFYSNVCSEEYPAIREEDALSKWVSDPANTAWMESKFSSSFSNEKYVIFHNDLFIFLFYFHLYLPSLYFLLGTQQDRDCKVLSPA